MNSLRFGVGSLPLSELRRRASLSTAAAAAAAAAAGDTERRTRGWADTLYNRVLLVADPKVSVVPVLEKWVEEGKPASKEDLQSMIKQMRTFRRYVHGLQISLWMSDRRYLPLSPGDLADRLDLIYKVQGLEHAENYFNNMSVQKKAYQTYGALLNCYAEERSVEKAEATFQKMKELEMLSSFPYNTLMKLYSYSEQHKKVNSVFQEMENKGIAPDVFTYGILMDAYTTATDVKGIDKLMRRLRRPNAVKSWYVYAAGAKGYAKAGLIDKALVALKMSEELIPRKKARVAYGFLLTVYAEMGNRDELYRIWYKFKTLEKQSNSMYMCMICGLLKLDDIDGAGMILKEWQSKTDLYDFRVPNLLVSAYCKNGSLGKAESLVNDAISSGRTPLAYTWDLLAGAYFEDDQFSKAVEFMKKALVAGQQRERKPNYANVLASLEYFKSQKNVEGAEEFVGLLGYLGPPSREVYHCLLEIYLVAEKPVTFVLDRMKKDGFDADEDTNRILERENPKEHS